MTTVNRTIRGGEHAEIREGVGGARPAAGSAEEEVPSITSIERKAAKSDRRNVQIQTSAW